MKKFSILIWIFILLLPYIVLAQDTLEATVTVNYTIDGQYIGWLETGIMLEADDIYEISAAGAINIWPNCEETKVEQGYPDIDCSQVIIGPNGTTVFPLVPDDYPYPGGQLGALAARVGDEPSFVVGTGGLFRAETAGELQIAFNDIQIMQDNQGFFDVTITVPEPRYVPSTNGTWQLTDIFLEEGQVFTILANGRVNIWSNCEETKAEQGYPDIDCDVVTNLTPEGTAIFPPAGGDYPMPGENVGALLGLIEGGQAFLISAGGTFVADSTGYLSLTVNDTEFFAVDDEGEFGVVVHIEGAGDYVYLPGTIDDWVRTGVILDAGNTLSVDASGTVNLWPRCEQEKDGAGLSDIDCGLMAMGPDGTVAVDLGSETHPLPGARVGALIGKIAVDGQPFLIGAGGNFLISQPGELYIRINDNFGMGDNEGGFTSLITVEPQNASND